MWGLTRQVLVAVALGAMLLVGALPAAAFQATDQPAPSFATDSATIAADGTVTLSISNASAVAVPANAYEVELRTADGVTVYPSGARPALPGLAMTSYPTSFAGLEGGSSGIVVLQPAGGGIPFTPASLTYTVAKPEDPKQPEPSFVGDSVTVFLQGEPLTLVSVILKNDSDTPLEQGTFRLFFGPATLLGEPLTAFERVSTRIRIRTVTSETGTEQASQEEPEVVLPAVPGRSIERITLGVSGLKAGWEGVVILEPCTPDPPHCETPPVFKPMSIPFSVVNRTVDAKPVWWAFGIMVAFLVVAGIAARARGRSETMLAWSDGVAQWGSKWTLKDNVNATFTFVGAALAAVAGATGKLDGLAGVDIGLFVGYSFMFTAIAASSAVVVRIGRTDGLTTPRVLPFWAAMAVSVFGAAGFLTSLAFLVLSMNFSSGATKPSLIGLIGLGAVLLIAFSTQVVVHQTTTPESEPNAEKVFQQAATKAARKYLRSP